MDFDSKLKGNNLMTDFVKESRLTLMQRKVWTKDKINYIHFIGPPYNLEFLFKIKLNTFRSWIFYIRDCMIFWGVQVHYQVQLQEDWELHGEKVECGGGKGGNNQKPSVKWEQRAW